MLEEDFIMDNKKLALDERTERTAKQFNILDKIEKLQNDLMQVDGVTEVEFDIDGFYDYIQQVVFLTKYDIPVSLENYFDVRKTLINNVLEVAKNNGLSRTGDRIEDYGEHFYFVMKCNNEWIK